MMEEFDLIRRLFAPLAKESGRVRSFGLTDDAALLTPRAGYSLAVSVDSYVSGIHFRHQDPPDLIGEKVFAAALSDLAAKSARPLAWFLSAGFARHTPAKWLRAFATGLARAQKLYDCPLAGGDSVSLAAGRGHAFSLTFIGEVKENAMPRRAGMKAGDLIFVSGTLGDSALGLRALRGGLRHTPPQARRTLIRRYQRPEARLALGLRLGGLVSAMMDISDGLAGDIAHLAAASKTGAELDASRLPLSPAAAQTKLAPALLRRLQLTGGDDYELLFALPPAHEKRAHDLAKTAQTPIHCIGRATKTAGIKITGKNGKPLTLSQKGWRHAF